MSHLAHLSSLALNVGTLCTHTQTPTAVGDLMRQSDKVVRQKQQHFVYEAASFFQTSPPPTDYNKKG